MERTGRQQIAVRPTEAGVGLTQGTSLFTAASVKDRAMITIVDD